MRHPGDTVSNTFIGSLAAMQPRDFIRLCMVYLEQLKEWLSNAEGPDLVEGMETATSDKLLGMAVSFDPIHYYVLRYVTGGNGFGLQTGLHPHGVLQLLADNTSGLVCQSKGEDVSGLFNLPQCLSWERGVPAIQGIPCVSGPRFPGAGKQPLQEESSHKLPRFQAPLHTWTQSQV